MNDRDSKPPDPVGGAVPVYPIRDSHPCPGSAGTLWEVDYRLAHWIGYFGWGLFTIFAHRATVRYLPERDPYILPAASLLSGWGVLTIWRLDEAFGVRQTIWLGVSVLVFVLALRFVPNFLFCAATNT